MGCMQDWVCQLFPLHQRQEDIRSIVNLFASLQHLSSQKNGGCLHFRSLEKSWTSLCHQDTEKSLSAPRWFEVDCGKLTEQWPEVVLVSPDSNFACSHSHHMLVWTLAFLYNSRDMVWTNFEKLLCWGLSRYYGPMCTPAALYSFLKIAHKLFKVPENPEVFCRYLKLTVYMDQLCQSQPIFILIAMEQHFREITDCHSGG